MKNLNRFNVEFSVAGPFKPLTQLMAVLPSSSAHCLPQGWRPLMGRDSSPIADFYPLDFAIDSNGKKFLWQAVALLPWIDETRLLDEMKTIETTLTNEERRNVFGYDYIYIHRNHLLANSLTPVYHNNSPDLSCKLFLDTPAEITPHITSQSKSDRPAGIVGYDWIYHPIHRSHPPL